MGLNMVGTMPERSPQTKNAIFQISLPKRCFRPPNRFVRPPLAVRIVGEERAGTYEKERRDNQADSKANA